MPEIKICAVRSFTFYLKMTREQVTFSAFSFFSQLLLFFSAVVLYLCHICIGKHIRKQEKGGRNGFSSFLVSFLSPIGFCENIKAIY